MIILSDGTDNKCGLLEKGSDNLVSYAWPLSLEYDNNAGLTSHSIQNMLDQDGDAA